MTPDHSRMDKEQLIESVADISIVDGDSSEMLSQIVDLWPAVYNERQGQQHFEFQPRDDVRASIFRREDGGKVAVSLIVGEGINRNHVEFNVLSICVHNTEEENPITTISFLSRQGELLALRSDDVITFSSEDREEGKLVVVRL